MAVTRTAEDWEAVLIDCGVKETTATKWADAFADEVTDEAFSMGEQELDDFLGQVLHESDMLEHMSENLNYSADRIRQMGRASGPGTHWYAVAQRADELEHNPEALGNALYANRGGNGDEESGDGYKYRGRGPIQITFKNSYIDIGNLIGEDLESTPELLEQPHFALQATIAWWEGHVPDSCIGDVVKVTKRVNGGTFGIEHRKEITALARQALDEHYS
jgi:putative chitinase